MKLYQFVSLIYKPKSATYHISIWGSDFRTTCTYEQLHKMQYIDREIVFIDNYSPSKYCYNHWWVCIR